MANEALTVAVLDFVVADEKAGDTQGAEASNLLTSLLSAEEDLVLVERADLATLLSESELALSGTVSSDQAVQVGQLTGAKVLITGRMFSSGDLEYLVAKVISAETSRVFGVTAKYSAKEGFAAGVESLEEKVAETLAKRRNELVAEVESSEDRIARLKKLVENKKLPRVYVEIPEEHFGRTVPDPAAETEILKTLQEVGFPLSGTIEGADRVIRGEAFSEAAGRRAGLVSCRARVEIKITEKGSQSSLLVDRQTSMAIDLAENVAAKSALQNAGSELGERLVLLLIPQ
ncbi:MAG: curli assembly protein CsgG [Verrucomicrobiae bacterium]|nr:curli assembly protein CsgG [Verrucomicrobiae bacterium]